MEESGKIWVFDDEGLDDLVLHMSYLVAHALNGIDLMAEEPDFIPCDLHNAAQVDAVLYLYREGLLDSAVRPYVKQTGTWDWWNEEKDAVDDAWLLQRVCSLGNECPEAL